MIMDEKKEVNKEEKKEEKQEYELYANYTDEEDAHLNWFDN